MMTDKELLEAIRGDQMISAITVLLNVAAFGSTPRYEDGSETPNRLIQLGVAKFLHSLHSENNFEDEHAWLLSQIPMSQRYPDESPDIAELSRAAMSTWRTPTKYLKHLGDAMSLLCAGHRPSDEIIAAWLDVEKDDNRLQEFACEHGPVWAQGIGVIDAARLLADQPTEGVDHEMYNAESPHAGFIREETNMRGDAVMAYGARFTGHPGFGAVCVDKPEFANETANSLAGWIKQGATIDRVTLQAARDGIGEYLAACGSSAGVNPQPHA